MVDSKLPEHIDLVLHLRGKLVDHHAPDVVLHPDNSTVDVLQVHYHVWLEIRHPRHEYLTKEYVKFVPQGHFQPQSVANVQTEVQQLFPTECHSGAILWFVYKHLNEL